MQACRAGGGRVAATARERDHRPPAPQQSKVAASPVRPGERAPLRNANDSPRRPRPDRRSSFPARRRPADSSTTRPGGRRTPLPQTAAVESPDGHNAADEPARAQSPPPVAQAITPPPEPPATKSRVVAFPPR